VRYLNSVIGGLFAALVVLSAVAYEDSIQFSTFRLANRIQVNDHLSTIRVKIEAELNSRLSLVYGLSAFAKNFPNFSEEQFHSFASELSNNHKGIKSLQLAPGAVVTYIYPLKGNEAAIGHDLLADPTRRAAAERAIAEGKFIIAGPVNLKQGGVALIGRQPIYSSGPNEAPSPENFWGFSVILIDLEPLLKAGGVIDNSSDMQFALRGKNGLGPSGAVFYGNQGVFDLDPVILDISLPNGSWQLAGLPKNGWVTSWPGRIRLWVIGLGIAIILGISIYFYMRRTSELRDKEVERKKGEAKLKLSEERLKDSIESVSDGVILYDSDDRFVLCNSMTLKHLNDISDILIPGTKYEDISRAIIEQNIDVNTENLSVDEKFQKTIEFHRNPSEPYIRHEKDGRWIMINEYKTKTGGTFLVRTNITELKLAQEQAQLAKEEAEAANRTKSEFLASMSHELRTPMNAILGFGQLLENYPGETLSDRQHEYVQLILRSGEHLLGLINNVLDLARIESGKVDLTIERFSLRHTLEELAPMVERALNEKNVKLNTCFNNGENVDVLADRMRVKQIFLNLFSNAIKFNRVGGKIDIKCDILPDDMARISITDTGIGIPADKYNQVFEPFNRLGFDDYNIKGTGIGLTISKQLTELMSGRIGFESSESQGSTFWVEFPVAK